MGRSEGPSFKTTVVIPVQIRPAASRDLIDAIDWYEAQIPGLGVRFFEEFEQVVSRIEASRDQFPVVYRDAHRALLRRFPYGIFFRSYRGRTLLVAIADLRREATRWQSRI